MTIAERIRVLRNAGFEPHVIGAILGAGPQDIAAQAFNIGVTVRAPTTETLAIDAIELLPPTVGVPDSVAVPLPGFDGWTVGDGEGIVYNLSALLQVDAGGDPPPRLAVAFIPDEVSAEWASTMNAEMADGRPCFVPPFTLDGSVAPDWNPVFRVYDLVVFPFPWTMGLVITTPGDPATAARAQDVRFDMTRLT
jgi:hypothetical protein